MRQTRTFYPDDINNALIPSLNSWGWRCGFLQSFTSSSPGWALPNVVSHAGSAMGSKPSPSRPTSQQQMHWPSSNRVLQTALLVENMTSMISSRMIEPGSLPLKFGVTVPPTCQALWIIKSGALDSLARRQTLADWRALRVSFAGRVATTLLAEVSGAFGIHREIDKSPVASHIQHEIAPWSSNWTFATFLHLLKHLNIRSFS